jgi:non-ribosomal peptide synthetase component F
VNTYGPTEATVVATYSELVPGEAVTIGRPLPGCRIRLLDERLCPVAQGADGEICIGGIGVARGYVNLPARTRDRFVPDPFAPGERLYRSGDRGRFDDAGNLVYLGRREPQVKPR